MAFFEQAITVLQTLVIALGAGLGIWGVINLLEGYGKFSNSEHAIKAPADLKGLKTGVADGQENPWVNAHIR